MSPQARVYNFLGSLRSNFETSQSFIPRFALSNPSLNPLPRAEAVSYRTIEIFDHSLCSKHICGHATL